MSLIHQFQRIDPLHWVAPKLNSGSYLLLLLFQIINRYPASHQEALAKHHPTPNNTQRTTQRATQPRRTTPPKFHAQLHRHPEELWTVRQTDKEKARKRERKKLSARRSHQRGARCPLVIPLRLRLRRRPPRCRRYPRPKTPPRSPPMRAACVRSALRNVSIHSPPSPHTGPPSPTRSQPHPRSNPAPPRPNPLHPNPPRPTLP